MTVKRLKVRVPAVEAIQFDGENFKEINNWLKVAVFAEIDEEDRIEDPEATGELFTGAQNWQTRPGDWIVKTTETDVQVLSSIDTYEECGEATCENKSSGPHLQATFREGVMSRSEVVRQRAEK